MLASRIRAADQSRLPSVEEAVPARRDPKTVAREAMIEVARCSGTMTYSRLAARINGEFRHLPQPYHARDRRLFQLLGEISTAEEAEGRPMLSAVVVRVDAWGPGKGFFNLARRLGHSFPNTPPGRAEFWLSELQRIYDTAW